MNPNGMFQSQLERATMNSASAVFDVRVTPMVQHLVMGLPPELRQAWWDGFLASVVGAMSATMSDISVQQSCCDLYERAKDFASDQQKGQQP